MFYARGHVTKDQENPVHKLCEKHCVMVLNVEK